MYNCFANILLLLSSSQTDYEGLNESEMLTHGLTSSLFTAPAFKNVYDSFMPLSTLEIIIRPTQTIFGICPSPTRFVISLNKKVAYLN